MRSAISTITAEIGGGMTLYYSILNKWPQLWGYVSRLLMMPHKIWKLSGGSV